MEIQTIVVTALYKVNKTGYRNGRLLWEQLHVDGALGSLDIRSAIHFFDSVLRMNLSISDINVLTV